VACRDGVAKSLIRDALIDKTKPRQRHEPDDLDLERVMQRRMIPRGIDGTIISNPGGAAEETPK
jgi:hypothetical protein